MWQRRTAFVVVVAAVGKKATDSGLQDLAVVVKVDDLDTEDDVEVRMEASVVQSRRGGCPRELLMVLVVL